MTKNKHKNLSQQKKKMKHLQSMCVVQKVHFYHLKKAELLIPDVAFASSYNTVNSGKKIKQLNKRYTCTLQNLHG